MNKIHELNPLFVVFALIFIIQTVVACAPQAELGKAKDIETKPPVLQEKLAWEVEWGRLVKEAKKEGRISLHGGGFSPDSRAELTKFMHEKFGMELDAVMGKSAQLMPKILSEREAGLFLVDVYMGGPTDIINSFKPKGLIEPMGNVLFRPDVIDSSLWEGGLYFDKDGMVAGGGGDVSTPIAVNSKLVNQGEIKSYKDLLNPKWKGKIIMGDPTVTGGQQTVAIVMWMIMGQDFIEKLLQQNLVFSRDQRLIIDWLARGKFPIAVGPTTEMFGFIREGAPIVPIVPAEGSKVGGSPVVVLMKNAPHPSAARLFMNWILSQEGQVTWLKNEGKASRRKDVNNEWVHPEARIKPGIKYIIDNEQFTVSSKKEFQSRLAEVFGPYVK